MRTNRYLVPVLLAAGACSSRGEATACTAEAEPAVVVQLVDATQNTAILGATLVLSEGVYSETMIEGGDGTYYGGFERPGTYQVQATAAGYAPATVSDIRARALPCGPETQMIVIALQGTAAPVATAATIEWRDEDGTLTIGLGRVAPGGEGGDRTPAIEIEHVIRVPAVRSRSDQP